VETVIAPYIKISGAILDVGAHAGSHSILYSHIAPNAHIFAYEPQDRLFEILRHNIGTQQRSNITPLKIAIGNKNCLAQMHESVPDGPNCNKPLNTTDFFNLGGRQLGTGGEYVDICKLDDLFPAEPESRQIDFIKIDVEGFESFVVDGARALITRCRPVIFFEHNEKRVTPAMDGYYNPLPADKSIMDILRDLKYSITPYADGNFLALPAGKSLPAPAPAPVPVPVATS
jgi:FkbM family methyltransferase